MGVKKYTQIYIGAQAEKTSAPTTKKDSSKDKSDIEQLKKAIAKRFENPDEVKKAARIIEQLLNS